MDLHLLSPYDFMACTWSALPYTLPTRKEIIGRREQKPTIYINLTLHSLLSPYYNMHFLFTPIQYSSAAGGKKLN